MAGTAIHIKGLDELMKKVDRLGTGFDDFLADTMKAAVTLVHQKVPPYPPASHKPYPFVSAKQKAFVIYAIATGLIEVPYRRRASGGIGGSITEEVKSLGTKTVGIIGSNKEYAPWVISSETVGSIGPQATYHQGVWWTLQKVVMDSSKDVINLFTDRIRKELSKL